MVAGHRYLVAFPAPAAAGSCQPLLIDETEAAAKLGATPKDSVNITLNDLAGTTGLSYEWAGKIVNEDIKFGDFGTGIVPAGDGHVTVTAKGATDTVLMDEDNYVAPGNSVFGFFGPDATPGQLGLVDSASTMELNLVESLHALRRPEPPPRHERLPVVHHRGGGDREGWHDRSVHRRGHTVVPPPNRQGVRRDAPSRARGAPCRSRCAGRHVAFPHGRRYVPRGSLATTPGGLFDRTFTTLSGDTIIIGGRLHRQRWGRWRRLLLARQRHTDPSRRHGHVPASVLASDRAPVPS